MADKIGFVNGKLQRVKSDGTSGYWKEYSVAIESIRNVGQAAVFMQPDANTIGGWQIDSVLELLSSHNHVDTDWDEISDVVLDIKFETNVDNSGGNPGDTVDFNVVARFKGNGETVVKTQTVAASVVVGQAAQYTKFEAEATFVYNSGTDPIDVGDDFGILINLDTAASEVADVIVNIIEFKYRMKEPHLNR